MQSPGAAGHHPAPGLRKTFVRRADSKRSSSSAPSATASGDPGGVHRRGRPCTSPRGPGRRPAALHRPLPPRGTRVEAPPRRQLRGATRRHRSTARAIGGNLAGLHLPQDLQLKRSEDQLTLQSSAGSVPRHTDRRDREDAPDVQAGVRPPRPPRGDRPPCEHSAPRTSRDGSSRVSEKLARRRCASTSTRSARSSTSRRSNPNPATVPAAPTSRSPRPVRSTHRPPAHIEGLLAAISPRYHLHIRVLDWTGLRVGELQALTGAISTGAAVACGSHAATRRDGPPAVGGCPSPATSSTCSPTSSHSRIVTSPPRCSPACPTRDCGWR